MVTQLGRERAQARGEQVSNQPISTVLTFLTLAEGVGAIFTPGMFLDYDFVADLHFMNLPSSSTLTGNPSELDSKLHFLQPSNVLSSCPAHHRKTMALPQQHYHFEQYLPPPSRPSQSNVDPSVLHPDTPHASGSSDRPLPSAATLTPGGPLNNIDTSRQLQQETRPRPRIPSLTIRDRALSSSSTSSSSPVRRKPLPLTASPLATRYSSGEHLTTTLEAPKETFIRPYSVDSPTLYEFPLTSTKPFSPDRYSTETLSKTSDQAALTIQQPVLQDEANKQAEHKVKGLSLAVPDQTPPAVHALPKHARLASESAVTTTSEATNPWYSDSSSTTHSTMSIFSAKATPPHQINIPPNGISRTFSSDSHDSNTTIQKAPKSPGGSKLGSFFGWGGNTSSPPSSTTDFSDNSFSPIPSPDPSDQHISPSDASKPSNARNIPTAIDVPKANADAGKFFGTAHLQVPLATPTTPVQVEEMEKELKDISSELASSIRREMDLEDLVERLQSEAQNPSGAGKRTSDYFSDSGTSSVKYGEPDSRQDELDRMLRKTEQDKAQMRLELTNKIQDERLRRKQLEGQVRTLEEKASQVDLASMNSLDANGRLRDLETTCEDLRRRLAEERQVKDNFEDLLTALKGELQISHNERDNLRDEIVPQLRARVEGLEAQAAEHEKLTYEQSKAQQELQTLKKENSALVQAQKVQLEMQQQMKKFESIAEEAGPPSNRLSGGLTRSNSVALGSASRSRPPSLGRSASVKTTESREALAERVKDVELQRDALHSALKSLLERQEHQNRENQKKIRQLELERDKALSSSPRRLGYDREVANLREEINTLRRRADEAIEQKWQCEKGLSGLKMDLDRAEQEISSLRTLLIENDILIPGRRPSTTSRPGSSHANSASLERAYKDLQTAYVESLDRIKSLESSGVQDQDTLKAMQELEQSLAEAISERDFAQQEAVSLKEQADSLKVSEKGHVTDEVALADELRGSAKRVEELATQVRQQLASNATLRQRLADTIERGEKEQRANAQKIMFMQTKLKSLEDKLMIAQQASEEKISHHEDEIRELRENHNLQLQRMKEGIRSPRSFGPNSPATSMFAGSGKAPRIISTTSGKAITVSEDSKMEYLRQRVVELEGALTNADKEMEEVVGRMNIAQIEVMELQNEREEAVRETKRLQKRIEEERIRAFEGRFATLSS